MNDDGKKRSPEFTGHEAARSNALQERRIDEEQNHMTPSDASIPTFGRYVEPPLDDMTVEQRAAYDLVIAKRGEAPGPSKIWIENLDVMQLTVPLGVYFQLGNSSLSDAEREIAVNLINGKWNASYSNYEHEMIGEKAGLRPEQVQALIGGFATSFDDPRQQIIYEMTQSLIAPRIVPTGLYQRAIHLLGHKGLTDLTVVIGYFTMVSLTLAAYNVSWTQRGLQR